MCVPLPWAPTHAVAAAALLVTYAAASALDECTGDCFTCLPRVAGACAHGQSCIDPDTRANSLGDWRCVCNPPAAGLPTLRANATCTLDECAGVTCDSGHRCVDPDTTVLDNWYCDCAKGQQGLGRVHRCPLDECVDTCATCLHPDTCGEMRACEDPVPTARSLRDWMCKCVAPAVVGLKVGKAVNINWGQRWKRGTTTNYEACILDECMVCLRNGCVRCGPGQTCNDPNTDLEARRDWTCSCPPPLVGTATGGAAKCTTDVPATPLPQTRAPGTIDPLAAVPETLAPQTLVPSTSAPSPARNRATASFAPSAPPPVAAVSETPIPPLPATPSPGPEMRTPTRGSPATPAPSTAVPPMATLAPAPRVSLPTASPSTAAPMAPTRAPAVTTVVPMPALPPTVPAAATNAPASHQPQPAVVDECAGRAVCADAGQTCVDPDTETQGDWMCVCRAPSTGMPARGGAAVCAFDECATYQVVCEEATPPQVCRDPDVGVGALNDWECVCVAPLVGVGVTDVAECGDPLAAGADGGAMALLAEGTAAANGTFLLSFLGPQEFLEEGTAVAVVLSAVGYATPFAAARPLVAMTDCYALQGPEYPRPPVLFHGFGPAADGSPANAMAVANLTAAAAVWFLMQCVVTFKKCCKGHRTSDPRGSMRFPSLALWFFMAVGPGLLLGCFSMLLRNEGGRNFALGGLGVAAWCLVMAHTYGAVRRGLVGGQPAMRYVTAEDIDGWDGMERDRELLSEAALVEGSDPSPRQRSSKLIVKWCVHKGEWVPAAPQLRLPDQYGSVLRGYRDGRTWYFLADAISITLLCLFHAGARGDAGPTPCGHAKLLSAFVTLVALVLQVYFKPQSLRSGHYIGVASLALQVAALFTTAVGLYGGHDTVHDRGWVGHAVVEGLMVTCVVLQLLHGGIDAAAALYSTCTNRRELAQHIGFTRVPENTATDAEAQEMTEHDAEASGGSFAEGERRSSTAALGMLSLEHKPRQSSLKKTPSLQGTASRRVLIRAPSDGQPMAPDVMSPMMSSFATDATSSALVLSRAGPQRRCTPAEPASQRGFGNSSDEEEDQMSNGLGATHVSTEDEGDSVMTTPSPVALVSHRPSTFGSFATALTPPGAGLPLPELALSHWPMWDALPGGGHVADPLHAAGGLDVSDPLNLTVAQFASQSTLHDSTSRAPADPPATPVLAPTTESGEDQPATAAVPAAVVLKRGQRTNTTVGALPRPSGLLADALKQRTASVEGAGHRLSDVPMPRMTSPPRLRAKRSNVGATGSGACASSLAGSSLLDVVKTTRVASPERSPSSPPLLTSVSSMGTTGDRLVSKRQWSGVALASPASPCTSASSFHDKKPLLLDSPGAGVARSLVRQAAPARKPDSSDASSSEIATGSPAARRGAAPRSVQAGASPARRATAGVLWSSSVSTEAPSQRHSITGRHPSARPIHAAAVHQQSSLFKVPVAHAVHRSPAALPL